MNSFRNLCHVLCQNPFIAYNVHYTCITYSFPVEISHGRAGVKKQQNSKINISFSKESVIYKEQVTKLNSVSMKVRRWDYLEINMFNVCSIRYYFKE
jgi:hypothetical protein